MLNYPKSPGYGLALHTTTPQLGLALDNFQGDFRYQTWDLGQDLGTHLHSYLGQFLGAVTWLELGFIAVAKGPGSFTGARLGVVTARTLAQQCQIPLFTISTLEALAWEHREQVELGRLLAVEMTARRGECFGGIYRSRDRYLETYQPDTTFSGNRWQEILTNLPEPYQLLTSPAHLGYTVPSILALADRLWQRGDRPHWSAAIPFYGQHPVENP